MKSFCELIHNLTIFQKYTPEEDCYEAKKLFKIEIDIPTRIGLLKE